MIRMPWRRKNELPPEGVRLVLADGARVPCGVLRDPGQDKDGCAMWVAVPIEEPAGRPVGVEADVIPGRAMLSVRVEL